MKPVMWSSVLETHCMPNKIQKKHLDSLQKPKQVSRKVGDESLQRVTQWVAEYVKMVNEIDRFYVKKFTEYASQFISMQAKYYQKLYDEQKLKSEDTEKSVKSRYQFINPLDNSVLTRQETKVSLDDDTYTARKSFLVRIKDLSLADESEDE